MRCDSLGILYEYNANKLQKWPEVNATQSRSLIALIHTMCDGFVRLHTQHQVAMLQSVYKSFDMWYFTAQLNRHHDHHRRSLNLYLNCNADFIADAEPTDLVRTSIANPVLCDQLFHVVTFHFKWNNTIDAYPKLFRINSPKFRVTLFCSMQFCLIIEPCP